MLCARKLSVVWLALLATAYLNACVTPKEPREDYAPEWMSEYGSHVDHSRPREGRGPEWISVSVSSDDRRGSDEAEVDDSAAFGLEGGYNVLNTKHVDAGFELGVVWSRHDVPQTTGTNSSPWLSVTRWNLGLRGSLDFTPLNGLIYVDGGLYVRDENSNDEPSFEQSGRGSYVGAGLDFWFDTGGRMGPFVRYYDFADSDLTEVLVGLSATFSL